MILIEYLHENKQHEKSIIIDEYLKNTFFEKDDSRNIGTTIQRKKLLDEFILFFFF